MIHLVSSHVEFATRYLANGIIVLPKTRLARFLATNLLFKGSLLSLALASTPRCRILSHAVGAHALDEIGLNSHGPWFRSVADG